MSQRITNPNHVQHGNIRSTKSTCRNSFILLDLHASLIRPIQHNPATNLREISKHEIYQNWLFRCKWRLFIIFIWLVKICPRLLKRIPEYISKINTLFLHSSNSACKIPHKIPPKYNNPYFAQSIATTATCARRPYKVIRHIPTDLTDDVEWWNARETARIPGRSVIRRCTCPFVPPLPIVDTAICKYQYCPSHSFFPFDGGEHFFNGNVCVCRFLPLLICFLFSMFQVDLYW